MPGINRQQRQNPFERYGGHPLPALQAIEGQAALSPAFGGSYGPEHRAFGQSDSPSTMFNPYKMRGYLSGNQNVADNTLTTILFDTASFDTNNNFSAAANGYVAPLTGYYDFKANLTVKNPQAASTYQFSYISLRPLSASVAGVGSSVTLTQDTNTFSALNTYVYADILPLKQGQIPQIAFSGLTTPGGGTWVVQGGLALSYFSVELIST